MNRPNLLLERIRILLSARMIAAYAMTYVALLAGISLFRYWMLIESSLAVGRFDTAWRAATAALRDLWPVGQPVAWEAAVALAAAALVLAGAYIPRARGVFMAKREAGLSVGALIVFLLGLGCLSCGTALAAFLAAIFGAGLMPVLYQWGPLAAYAGLLLLCAATLLLAKKVTDPLVC